MKVLSLTTPVAPVAPVAPVVRPENEPAEENSSHKPWQDS